jgi:hypothetical protein
MEKEMTPIEAAARALYEREKERANLCNEILSKAAGKPIIDHMEPWEECSVVYTGDAVAALEAAVDQMGWPEIHAFNAEKRKGQGIYEDAGGYLMRCFRRLFGLPEQDEEVISYQKALRAMIHGKAA